MHDERTVKQREDILQLASQARAIEDACNHLDEYARAIDGALQAVESAREALSSATSAIESLGMSLANLAHVDASELLGEIDAIKGARPEFKFEERQLASHLESMRQAADALTKVTQDMDGHELKNLDDRLISLDWRLDGAERAIEQADEVAGNVYGVLWRATNTLPENTVCMDMTELVLLEREDGLPDSVSDLKFNFEDYAVTQAVRGGRAFTGEDGHLYLAGSEMDVDADAENVHVLGMSGYRQSLREQESRDELL